MEKKLLNPTDIERMTDAPDAEAAFRVFNDTDYADNLLDVKVEDFRKALDDDLKQTKDIYDRMIDDRNLLEFLFIRYDFHNIKLGFKAKFLEKDLSEYETNLGTVPAEQVRKYIVESGEASLTDKLKQIIDEAAKEFESNNDPNYIDSFLDTKMYEYLDDLTKNLNNDYISNFLKIQIDLVNIKILLRTKRMGRDINFLKQELIEGGNREANIYVGLFEQDLKAIIKELSKYFDNKLTAILDEYAQAENLWKLEQNFENYELNYLQETKRLADGPELAVAYYYAKRNAIRNVRLVMTGKLNGVEAKEIKERVRSVF